MNTMQLLSSTRFIKKCPIYGYSNRVVKDSCNGSVFRQTKFVVKASSVCYREDDDGDSDDERNRNKKNKKPDQLYNQQILQLNKLFYLDHTLSPDELEDLILGTFKKFYKISLEVINESVCLVIYPEVKQSNDMKYKEDLKVISELLSDLAVKQFIYDEFKKINKPIQKDRYIVLLPIKNIF